MTGIHTLGNAENPSTGTLDGAVGYRHWDIRNGELISPFVTPPVALPANGIAVHACFYNTRADLEQALWFLDPTRTAWTTGTITGPRPDPNEQSYKVHGRTFPLPDAWIADRYQVTAIHTNCTTPLRYTIPITRWTD